MRYLVSLVVLGACGMEATLPAPLVSDSIPPMTSTTGEATFVFHADGADFFECQLDSDAPARCTSPHKVMVGEGTHTMTITAYDGDTALPNPIMVTWLVDMTPPDTSITNAPAAFDNSLTTSFSFVGVPTSDTDHFTCALDGASFATCTSPQSITTTAGMHTFYVRAHDAVGNVDPTPAQHMWMIDTTMIDTTITAGPAQGAETQGNVSFSFTANDSGATFECGIDASAYSPCTSPAQFSSLTEGSHTFSVRARKGANIDPTPATRTWMVDLTPPPVTITQAPPAESNDASPTFTFSSTDTTATFECAIDGFITFTACTSPWTPPSNVPQNPHTFRVRATDPAGNSAQASYSWNLDLTPPNPTITQGPAPTTSDPNATFYFQATGIPVLFECQIDGVVNYTPCTSPWSYLVPGGMRTFHVRASDAAGNSAIANWSWTVNLPGPTVSITDGPSGPTNSTTALFTFTTAGAVTMIDCSLDGAAYAACTSPATYSSLAEGDHTFIVRVRDASNNTSTDTRNFTVDVTAPTATLCLSPPAVTRDRHPVVGWNTTETPYTTGILVDGSGVQEASPPGLINTGCAYLRTVGPPLADGAHTITIRVCDAALNCSMLPLPFTVDTIGPTVTLDSAPTNPNPTKLATFTFSSPDAVGFECQLDNVAYASCTSPFTAFVGDGVHTFNVRGLDAYGNGTIKHHVWTNEGDPFVTTSLGGYDNGQSISVSWRGLPGNALDWVSIAPEGSADTTYTQRIYTNGATSGSTTFAVTTNGNYVIRAYVNDTFTKLAQSTVFSVSSPCATLSYAPATAIHTPGDVTSLAPYTHLGNLTISLYSNFTITLPCLEQVDNLIVNDASGFQVLELHMPRLRTIGQDIRISNGPPTLDIPMLTSIPGTFSINQSTLPDLSPFRRITSVNQLGLLGTGVVGPLDFAGLTAMPPNSIQFGNVAVYGFNNITTLAGSNLSIGAPTMGGFNGLVNVPGNAVINGGIDGGFKRLASVGGDATFTITGAQNAVLPSLDHVDGYLLIKPSGPQITSLSLPLLRKAYRFHLEGVNNTSIATIDAPLLSDLFYDIELRLMPQMTTCQYYNLVDQLTPLPLYLPAATGLSSQYGTCTFNF